MFLLLYITDNDKIVTDIMNYLFMSEQAILKAANDNCNTKVRSGMTLSSSIYCVDK